MLDMSVHEDIRVACSQDYYARSIQMKIAPDRF
jgi:hypothetical protein